MLCCVGLFGGIAVGQALGGPWTVIAPAAGFGLGFLADMKLMHGTHGKGQRPQEPAVAAGNPAGPPAATRPDRVETRTASAGSGQGSNDAPPRTAAARAPADAREGVTG